MSKRKKNLGGESKLGALGHTTSKVAKQREKSPVISPHLATLFPPQKSLLALQNDVTYSSLPHMCFLGR